MGVKIIRNKQTGYSEGYGFADFADRASAESALRALNGVPMPSAAPQTFRLNWASFGVGQHHSANGRTAHARAQQHSGGSNPAGVTNLSSGDDEDTPEASSKRASSGEDTNSDASPEKKKSPSDASRSPDDNDPPSGGRPNNNHHLPRVPSTHSVFVGDLPPEVNDYALQETFSSRYPSVRNARVVTDPQTGRSKGFGFVRFADEAERDAALVEMHGERCGSRPMRTSLAIPRRNNSNPSHYAEHHYRGGGA